MINNFKTFYMRELSSKIEVFYISNKNIFMSNLLIGENCFFIFFSFLDIGLFKTDNIRKIFQVMSKISKMMQHKLMQSWQIENKKCIPKYVDKGVLLKNINKDEYCPAKMRHNGK